MKPEAIFRGRTIPACCKPEFKGIFKLTFQGLKNAVKSLRLDEAIPEILKPHQMVSCSSREILSLIFILKNSPGLQFITEDVA
jgi:hypothetical protein